VEPYAAALQQLEVKSANALSALQQKKYCDIRKLATNLLLQVWSTPTARKKSSAAATIHSIHITSISKMMNSYLLSLTSGRQAARNARLQRLEAEAEQQVRSSKERLEKFMDRSKPLPKPTPAIVPAKPAPQPAPAPAPAPKPAPGPGPAAKPQPTPGLAVKPAPQPAPAPKPAPSSGPAQALGTVTQSTAEEHARSLQYLEQIARELQGLQCDPALKADITKRVHLNIIQISAKADQVRAKIETLAQIIQGASRSGTLVRLFALDLLAQKIVVRSPPGRSETIKSAFSNPLQAQGETQVSAHAPSAFPIAVVATALCTIAPDLTPIIVARFHSVCCYTVPYYIPKRQGQTDEDYLTSIGYKRRASGLETEEAYMNRMEGYISLYAAIMQTDAIGGTCSKLSARLKPI
jgi:outer membrane biosynthesis protein TonB